jgi:hypothetical protein
MKSHDADVLESYVVDKVKKRFESTGWLHRKVTYQGRRGAPDDWFFGTGARMIIIEFKKPLKKPKLQQTMEHDRFRERGFKVYVVDNVDSGYALHARLEEIASLA